MKCSDLVLCWIQRSVWLAEGYSVDWLEQEVHPRLSEFLAHEKAAGGKISPVLRGHEIFLRDFHCSLKVFQEAGQ